MSSAILIVYEIMYTNSLVNANSFYANLFYANFTNTTFQKIPIPHLILATSQADLAFEDSNGLSFFISLLLYPWISNAIF